MGATNPKTMTTKDLLFETFVSIPQKEIFLIKTANAQEYPISIKSYNNKISNFSYDELANKISYEMSLDDEHAMQHDFISKHVIMLQKDFSSFKQGYDLDVFVQGIKLEDDSVEFDISSPDQNIIRTNITHEKLMYIEDKVGTSNPLKVEILSGDRKIFNELNFIFENGFSANVSWDSNSDVGKKTPFIFSFFDAMNKPVQGVLFAYSITDSAGKEIWSNIGTGDKYLGILTSYGISQESILIPTQGQHKIKLILTGQNSKNFAEFLTSTADFKIDQPLAQQKTGIVPSWIKNNAGWWSQDLISERDFVKGIEFLVSQGIVTVN